MGGWNNWLFDNPRRFAIVSALGLLALIGAGFLVKPATGSKPADPAATSSEDLTTMTYEDSSGDVVEVDVPNPQQFIQAAVNFVDAWGSTQEGESEAAWRTRVVPLATAEFGKALTLVEVESLPQTSVSGPAKVQFVAGTSALIEVPLADSSSVFVTVVKLGSAYRISDLQPAVGDDGLEPATEP